MTVRVALRIAAACVVAGALLGCGTRPDSVSGASTIVSTSPAKAGAVPAGRPVIVTPSERGGAARLASVIAERLGADVVSPANVSVEDLEKASLIGLGSGIFDQAHHASLLALAEALPWSPGRKVFLFSTSGISRAAAPNAGAEDPHKALRERLAAKGFEIVGEFNCVGFNDNSFLFLFGGMNKGHPDARDIANAKAFADSLRQDGDG